MNEKKTISFTYDPLYLVRIVLQRYAEELEGKDVKAIQFARYEYLRTLTDEELEGLLIRYVKEENLEAITLEDWRTDAECVFRYIYESKRYKMLLLGFNKSGFGVTGLGVVDRSDNTFYDCSFTQHWQKVMEIIKEKYTHYHEALEELYFNERVNEYEGVSRSELDSFILENFELVGQNKSLDSYLA